MPQSELLSKGEEVLFDHFNGNVSFSKILYKVYIKDVNYYRWVAYFLLFD